MIRAVPVQARAKKRYEAILAAAREHYTDVGRDRFNLDTVAELAGCSVATIYRYFEDRMSLLEVAVPETERPEDILEKIRDIARTDETPSAKWRATEKLI